MTVAVVGLGYIGLPTAVSLATGGLDVVGVSQSDTCSGLVARVHLDADGHSGAVISIPANSLVRVPGHGTTELWNALELGGPSLLIETVEDLTECQDRPLLGDELRGCAPGDRRDEWRQPRRAVHRHQ